MSDTVIDVEIEDEAWSRVPAVELLVRAAAAAALEEVQAPEGCAVTVLLADDAAVAELNHRFRGKTGPTNVLSFPAPENPENHLGDIALAHGVCAREAGEQNKTLEAHLQHLVAHGVLHLVGYDHQTDDEAEDMEELERAIMAGLGHPDPYR